MIIKVSNRIEFKDSSSDMRKDGNTGSFDWTCIGDSEEIIDNSEDGLATNDFKLTNANKFVYELKPGNTFDVLLQQDVIRCDSIDNIASLHVFCYESNSINSFRTPIRFDVYLEDVEMSLGNMSEFSLTNVKNLSTDIRISNIVVPDESKATLVIIIAVND
jgi:hypothetical protein